jgi:hypothetical protein
MTTIPCGYSVTGLRPGDNPDEVLAAVEGRSFAGRPIPDISHVKVVRISSHEHEHRHGGDNSA